jgi:hypothetical protein
MDAHKFKVGQTVRLARNFPDRSGGGVYKVTRALPAEGGELSYRIKGQSEGPERAVRESEIERV